MMAYHQGLLRQRGFGDYHRGLIRQKGFGLVGSLLKIGGPLVTGALGPVIGEVLGGLVRKNKQEKESLVMSLKEVMKSQKMLSLTDLKIKYPLWKV